MTKRKTPTKNQKPTFNKEAYASLMFENIEERLGITATVLDGIKERLEAVGAYQEASEIDVLSSYICGIFDTASMASDRMKDA